MELQQCASCDEYKPHTQFAAKGEGLQRECKTCRNAYNRIYYHSLKEKPLVVLEGVLARIEKRYDEGVANWAEAYRLAISVICERIEELTHELRN